MSSITIDHDELIGKRMKHQRYKEILDAQIREKNGDNSFRKRNHTTIDRSSPSFYFQKNEVIPPERRLIQQSTFLPSIPDKVSRVRRGHERSYTHGYEDDIDNNNFETDAIDYLRDCETILENLKRLTKNSAQKISNTKILDKIQNGQRIRNSLRIEKQPSFFRSPEIDSSLVLKPNRSLKKKNDNSYYDENQRSEDSQMKTISRKSSEELKQDLTLKGKTDVNEFLQYHCNNEEELKTTQEEKIIQTKISLKDEQNETQSTNIKNSKNIELNGKDKTKEAGEKDLRNQSNTSNNYSNGLKSVPENSDGLINQTRENHECEESEVFKNNKTIERSESSPQERKQKFLLKFLNKANTRGIELHKRIMEHKLKNRSSIISVSNLSGKKKEMKDNIDKEKSISNDELHEKVEEKEKIEHLDETKSTEREGDKISIGQTSKFEEEKKTGKKDQTSSSRISENEQNEKDSTKLTNPAITLNIGKNDLVGENKINCERNPQNQLNILQKASDGEEEDSEEEDSSEDEEEEEELPNKLLKGENNNNKTLNPQNEPKQSAN